MTDENDAVRFSGVKYQYVAAFTGNASSSMREENKQVQFTSVKYQYLAALSGTASNSDENKMNLLTFTYGIACGWLTPILPKLETEDSPLPGNPLTLDETSWIASIVCIGGIIGNIFFGFAMDIIGRKKSLLLIVVPAIMGWLSMLFAQNVYYLYANRILCGFYGGGIFVVVPAYLLEISNDKVRGALNSFLILSCNFGITTAFVLGYYFSFNLISQVPLAFIVIAFVITLIFLPETPLYLVKNDRISEAENSIRFFRNLGSERINVVQMEITRLKSICNEELATQASKSLSWSDLKTVEARKAFSIGMVLVILAQFSGPVAVLTYSDSIVEDAGVSVSPAISAIIISILQTIGSYLPTVLADRAGRKFLLVLSALGTAFGLCVLGSFTLFKPDLITVQWISYIPLGGLVCIIFFGSCGIISMPFGIIAEILPEKVKSFGLTFLVTVLWSFCLLVLKFFPFIMEAIGLHSASFIFAGVCIVGSIFLLIVMPETKGKSYEEIMASLR